MNKHLLAEYLKSRHAATSELEDAATLHRELCAADPEFYLKLLADPVSQVSHKREVLANLVANPTARDIAPRRIVAALRTLPAAEALRVLDALRQRRINRARGREVGLRFLLGHEEFLELAATRRQRVAHLLRHLLGERTWSAAGRFLAGTTPEGERFLRRTLLRYAAEAEAAREGLCFLAGAPGTPSHPQLARSLAARQDLEQGAGLPRETLFGLRGIYHKTVPASRVRYLAAVETEATHGDGPLTALYKEVLFEGAEERHARELPERLAQAVDALPEIAERLAVVLDLSASAVSSGERTYHPAALALALARIIQERVSEVTIYQVGGSAPLGEQAFPAPQGATDLATAILAAARQAPEATPQATPQAMPQAIVVITDGYENARQGDAGQVVRGLRQLGLELPIYQVVPAFTAAEDLTQRRLDEAIPALAIAREDGVRELLAQVLLATASDPVTPAEMELLRPLVAAR